MTVPRPISGSKPFRLYALAAITCLLAALLPILQAHPAHAVTNQYYFHGAASDQVTKATTATFNTTPPSGAVPVIQTTSPLANQDYAGDPLAAFWKGPFTGPVNGALELNWYWSSPNPEVVLIGLEMDVTVFADPNLATGTATVLGRRTVHLTASPAPTLNTNLVPVAGSATQTLMIQAVPHFVDTGNGATTYYDSTATPSGFSLVAAPAPPAVAFESTTRVAFAPSTVVSASFFGAEPETTLERRLPSSQPGRLDNRRIFIDWPLSSRTQTSQLSRSTDGGDRFRMLLDLVACPQRNRPNCVTGGGGDSKNEVNLVNGNLYFADQEVVVNEATASSTDHGDTWPVARQFPLSNLATGVDRQWLAYIDPSIASVGPRRIEAFLSYHLPIGGEYIQGIDQDGLPIPQPAPQIPGVSQSGSSVVDNSNGPGRGWIYQPYRGSGGVTVATAFAPNYQNPLSWTSTTVSGDNATIFPWVTVDNHGNAYLVWVTNGKLFLSASAIDDPRNNPARGGRPGTHWSPQAQVNPPSITSTVFPEVTAGDSGRIAIAFDGSTDCSGPSDGCPLTSHWNTYVDVIPDALALTRQAPVTVTTGMVSHRVVHRGSICTSGTTCTGDRSLLDMIDLGFDSEGRVGVVFTDNNNRLAAPNLIDNSKAGPFTMFAKETAGPSLLAARPTVAVAIPTNGRRAPAGDATWPNTAAGRNLPSLDLLGASLSLSADGSQVVARVPIADPRPATMARDLATYNASTTEPGSRLQYTVRFSTPDDVFHLDMDVVPGTAPRFFAGRLDANDGVQNGTGTIVGSRYVGDPSYPATGSIDHNVLTIRAPASSFGLGNGSPVTGVSAFSFAGPTEADPTATVVINSMRTIDATPPFDATLKPAAAPTAPPGAGGGGASSGQGDGHPGGGNPGAGNPGDGNSDAESPAPDEPGGE